MRSTHPRAGPRQATRYNDNPPGGTGTSTDTSIPTVPTIVMRQGQGNATCPTGTRTSSSSPCSPYTGGPKGQRRRPGWAVGTSTAPRPSAWPWAPTHAPVPLPLALALALPLSMPMSMPLSMPMSVSYPWRQRDADT